MGLLDKVRSLFTRQAIPEETKLLLSGVKSVSDLRRGLDDIITRNEVERKEVEREAEKLSKIEEQEKERIRSANLGEREKLVTLRAIKRTRSRIESYEKRSKIHEENIDLHQALMDKIDEMEAMELKVVKRDQIDEIAVDYEERLEKHKELVTAGRVAQESDLEYEDAAEKRELEALEREIKGAAEAKAKEPKPKVQEPATAEPVTRPPIDEAIPEKPVARPIDEDEDEEDEDVLLEDRQRELE